MKFSAPTPVPVDSSRRTARTRSAASCRGITPTQLREPLTKLSQKPLRILLILETHSEVVRETHDNHLTVRIAAPPPISPLVEDVMEIDVHQQRRCRSALRRPLRGL